VGHQVKQAGLAISGPPGLRWYAGEEPGDGLVLIEKVYDPATGDRIGRSQTACTVINARHSGLQCTGTVVLPQGEIALQGGGQPPFAVTGGTGAFTGARGTVDGNEHDGRIDVTVHIVN